MRIFLTGATGYVGAAAFGALVRANHDVTALVRSPERADEIRARGGTPVLGDLSQPETYVTAAAGCEAYVHAAFSSSPKGVEIDRIAVETLLQNARASAADRPVVFIFTSGVWVLGPCSTPADETAPVNPIPHVAWRAGREQYVLSAAAGQLRTIVVRPGIVYGGARGIISGLLKDAENGLLRIVGTGDNHWALVYDRDLGDLYARLVVEPGASGVYHATDEGDESVKDIVDAIVAAMPHPTSVRSVPIAEMRKKLKTYADALALDQLVRSPRARAIGWAPTLRSVAVNVLGLLEERRQENA